MAALTNRKKTHQKHIKEYLKVSKSFFCALDCVKSARGQDLNRPGLNLHVFVGSLQRRRFLKFSSYRCTRCTVTHPLRQPLGLPRCAVASARPKQSFCKKLQPNKRRHLQVLVKERSQRSQVHHFLKPKGKRKQNETSSLSSKHVLKKLLAHHAQHAFERPTQRQTLGEKWNLT